MASINSKRTPGNRTGRQRLQQILRSPALPFILGQINPALGMAAGLGRGAMNIGQRIGYMFDNDDSTGFWRGENRGQPFFQGAREGWAALFGGPRGEPYSGPPALQEPGNRWESPSEANPFTPEDYARATSQGNWGGGSQQGTGQGMPRPTPSGYSGNLAADRATWGDYMGRMTQNMSPHATMQFISRGGVPNSALRGAERVMADGSSTTMGMGSAARLWGYSPFGTGLLFNDQRQAI